MHLTSVIFSVCVPPPTGFHYPLYGKTAGREESDLSQSNNSSLNSKPPCESNALELRQHHNLPYHGKSPVVSLHLSICLNSSSDSHIGFYKNLWGRQYLPLVKILRPIKSYFSVRKSVFQLLL